MLIKLSFSVIFALVFIWFWYAIKRASTKNSKSPLSGNFLRLPGESLQESLNKFHDEYLERVMTVVIVVYSLAMMVIFTDVSKIGNLYFLVGCVAIGATIAGYQIVKVNKLIKKITNYRLGLDGERYTGQALNTLVREGAYVFHDLIYGDGKNNVDHVIISTGGVIAVETKTFRKPLKEKLPKGVEAHKLFYDGKTLKFPHFTSSAALQQAGSSANALEKFIKNYCLIDKTITVLPVLVFPGWWVERRGKGKVRVLNADEIYHLTKNITGNVLTTDEVKVIVKHFDKVNKNVRAASKRLDPGAKDYYDKNWKPKTPTPNLD